MDVAGINFEVFREMHRLRELADSSQWFVSPEFLDDNESPVVSIGPREGEHYEETIAQFFGDGSGNHIDNAAFAAFCANRSAEICVEIEKIKKLVEGMTEAVFRDDNSALRELLLDLRAEKGFKIVGPDSEDQRSPGGNTKVFLAGSIDNGEAEDWQARVEKELRDAKRNVTLYNPRRVHWNPDLRQDISEPAFAHQVNWELDKIDAADIVFFYFSPDGPAPITLMEIGTIPRGKKAIVVCPEGYWRRGNVQIWCQRQRFVIYETLEQGLRALGHNV